MPYAMHHHARVRALVTVQLERAVDKALDIPLLHVDLSKIGQGGSGT
jgi:hypothetical protein